MSEVARKLAGTFIPENTKPPVLEWFQGQLRSGSLRHRLREFLRAQPEALDADRVQVESVNASGIRCRVPRFVVDHESPRPMRDDIEFELNPLSGQAQRLC